MCVVRECSVAASSGCGLSVGLLLDCDVLKQVALRCFPLATEESYSEMSPEEMLVLLSPHLAGAGITRVANVTGLDHVGIPVVLVTRPNSRSLSVSQGKGVTLAAAKVSGVMESLEQHHAEHVDHPLHLASYRERANRTRTADVALLPRARPIFDESSRLLWVTARHHLSGEGVDVPYELVHLDLTEPLPEGSGWFALGSNGLASGRTFEDAVSHALLELIERDCLALFYLLTATEQAARRLRLDSVGDEVCRELLERFANAGIGVAVWSISSDLAVPAFLCSVAELDVDLQRPVGTARGYGCHPDAAIALCRALTEAAQSRLTRIAGSRDDIQPEDLRAIRSSESIVQQLAHVQHESAAPLRFSDIGSHSFEDASRCLSWTCGRLIEKGFSEILTVDLSRGDLPVAVARVIVPGLEGFPDSPTYVPGPRARSRGAPMGERRDAGPSVA